MHLGFESILKQIMHIHKHFDNKLDSPMSPPSTIMHHIYLNYHIIPETIKRIVDVVVTDEFIISKMILKFIENAGVTA